MSLIKTPKLVVFDLDYTLWPFWVDTHVDPPFRIVEKKGIVDSRGKKVTAYTESNAVLQRLEAMGVPMGIASRTGEIEGAEQLVRLFGWNKYFSYKEIYPGSKDSHFRQFKKKSGIPYEEMLFFDDEGRNIRDVGGMGVTSILVKNGMNLGVLDEGLKEFTRARK